MEIDKNLVIAIPTYNEKENIRKLVVALLHLLPQVRLMVVDDNSLDGTAQAVQELAEKYPNVRLIWREKKQGLASAYLDAFARIIPDETIHYIATMDADFSHHPVDLLSLLEYIKDYELVIGSRYVPGGSIINWNFLRRLLSRCANKYARVITGVPIEDLTAGFAIYRRELLAQILGQILKSEGYAYQIEMKYRADKLGAKIKEVPITFRERQRGKSKLNRAVIWEGIIMPWSLTFKDRIKFVKSKIYNMVNNLRIFGKGKDKGEG